MVLVTTGININQNKMGIKALKNKYKIEHIVTKQDNHILIGSPYIRDIIKINMEGEIVIKYKNRKYDDGWNTNEDLKRYQEEMIADQESGELRRIVNLQDIFTNLKPVFTSKGGEIIETQCEAYGWPNTDIKGNLMYDNTYHKTYAEAYKYLLKETEMRYTWRNWKQSIIEIFQRLKRVSSFLLRDAYYFFYARSIQYLIGVLRKIRF